VRGQCYSQCANLPYAPAGLYSDCGQQLEAYGRDSYLSIRVSIYYLIYLSLADRPYA